MKTVSHVKESYKPNLSDDSEWRQWVRYIYLILVMTMSNVSESVIPSLSSSANSSTVNEHSNWLLSRVPHWKIGLWQFDCTHNTITVHSNENVMKHHIWLWKVKFLDRRAIEALDLHFFLKNKSVFDWYIVNCPSLCSDPASVWLILGGRVTYALSWVWT